MPSLIYNGTEYKESATPQVYNETNSAFEDATGKRYDGSEWQDAWSTLFQMTIGQTYNFTNTSGAACNATCLAISSTTALLMSNGVWAASWPGQQVALSSSNFGTLRGAVTNIYTPIGQTTYYIRIYALDGSWSQVNQSTVLSQMQSGAKRYRSLSATYSAAWLGTPSGNSNAYSVYDSSGSAAINSGSRSDVCVVAPSFHLDLTKVKLVDGILTAK